jgi:hypothetical protein
VTRTPSWTEGPRLLAVASAALLATTALLLASGGLPEENVRAVIRTTARTSLSFFSAAFSASSLHQLLRRPATAWMLRNRRWLGLSLAVSHTIHLAAILSLAFGFPSEYATVLPLTRVGGSVGFLAIAGMAATSSDRAVAALGASRWHALHAACGWIVWVVYAATYLPMALDPSRLPWTLLVPGVAALRFARWVQSREARHGATARSAPPSSSSAGQ